MPFFYFALCRSSGTIRFPNRLRRVSGVMAVLLGILAASQFVELIRALTTVGRQLRVQNLFGWAAAVTLNLACLWMLIALARARSKDSACKAPAPRLLRWFTYVLLVVGVFSLAEHIFAMISLAYVLENKSSILEKSHDRNLVFWVLMMIDFRALPISPCLFTPAYVVWRGWLRQTSSKIEHVSPATELIPVVAK